MSGAVYTPGERDRLRTDLVARARADPRISGVALTGSASVGREDRWSDIDLAFGVADPTEIPGTLADWTAAMYERHGAIHHVDEIAGTWTYRVFLLRNTLQVDLAFAPANDFRAKAPTFRLLSGTSAEPRHRSPPAAEELVGLAWLYALHARSSIARGKPWQAEFMISAVRDYGLALAALRQGLPTAYARGSDQLPDEVRRAFEGAIVRGLAEDELRRALRIAMDALMHEIGLVDPDLRARLQPTLDELASTPDPA